MVEEHQCDRSRLKHVLRGCRADDLFRPLRRLLEVAALAGAIALPTSVAAASFYNDGVEAYRAKNYQLARELWAKAVLDGEPSARNNLGFLLYYGLGGEPDLARAIVLWKESAIYGHSESQWHLGVAYEEGKGVDKNLVEAYAWYRCSIASAEAPREGDEKAEAEIATDAYQSLVKVLDKLPAADFDAARKQAKEYVQMFARKKP